MTYVNAKAIQKLNNIVKARIMLARELNENDIDLDLILDVSADEIIEAFPEYRCTMESLTIEEMIIEMLIGGASNE